MFGPNFWLHGQRNAAMFYWSHYTRAVRIKLKNTTDLFYRLGSILVTFLVIDLWFIYKVVEYISISPCDLQVQADLVCGARSLVLAWDKLHIISWNKLLWLNTDQQLVEGILYLSIRWEWACIGHPKFLILSSIIILQFAVVLAVSNVIWVRTSSCCEFKLVVMGTICIL